MNLQAFYGNQSNSSQSRTRIRESVRTSQFSGRCISSFSTPDSFPCTRRCSAAASAARRWTFAWRLQRPAYEGRPSNGSGFEVGAHRARLLDRDGRDLADPHRDRGRLPGQQVDPGGEPNRMDVMKTVRGLPDLAARVELRAAVWPVGTLLASFNTLAKVGSAPGADSELGRNILHTLMEAYLPLVPGLRDAKYCAIPLWACAKLGCWEGGLAEALLKRLRPCRGSDGDVTRMAGLLQRANDQDHANLWLAVSEDTVPPHILALAEDVLQASADALLDLTEKQLGPQACANILLACARLQWHDAPLLHHLTACLVAQGSANEQHLANALYALGELAEDCGHVPQLEDLQRLADEIEGRLVVQLKLGTRGFLPLHVSQMLLGCSNLRDAPPSLLPALTTAAGRQSTQMNGRMLTNSLYSLASMGRMGQLYTSAVQQLCREVQARLQRRPADLGPMDLALLLWSLEKLRPPDLEALADALAAECRARGFGGFTAQNLGNAIWALAKLRRGDSDWYEAAAEAASAPGAMAGAQAQEWSNVWYGLALVRRRPPEKLLAAMMAGQPNGSVLETFRRAASAQECSNMLWSLAVLGVYEQRLVDVLAGRLGQLLVEGGLEEQALANSLWALAVMGPDVLRRHVRFVEELVREVAWRWADAVRNGRSHLLFVAVELTQLWQVQQELQHLGGTTPGVLDRILAAAPCSPSPSASLLDAAAQAAAQQRVDGDRQTALQRQVLGCLQQLRRRPPKAPRARGRYLGDEAPAATSARAIAAVIPSYPVEALCRRVDVMVQLTNGRQVAVEVDEPVNFLTSGSHTRIPDGATRLRVRQLERVFGAGNVVSVPYWELRECRSEAERLEYVGRLLGL